MGLKECRVIFLTGELSRYLSRRDAAIVKQYQIQRAIDGMMSALYPDINDPRRAEMLLTITEDEESLDEVVMRDEDGNTDHEA